MTLEEPASSLLQMGQTLLELKKIEEERTRKKKIEEDRRR